ncbi:hypothetical protein RCL_jg1281.t1 [Rhizophagus clarus]|uniref:Uncharacterized protein n=1 Tax=Rhizophagus clarus TaxID=94130 RepID=A0A8H3QVA4_9GLOM|nr:hypothetical protein RCL_jg1281.t1 [Rhizophagus clarus]
MARSVRNSISRWTTLRVQNSISKQTTKSGTPFRDGPLSLELHFEADHFKSQNSISRQTTLRTDHFKFRTPFRGRSLKADYMIF